MKDLDLLGLGNALVDSIIPVTYQDLAAFGLAPGSMSLIEPPRAASLRDSLPQGSRASGGSVANTCATAAGLGCRTAFIGKVADDPLGLFFSADLDRAGVSHPTPAIADGPSTGHSMILVTPDGQRTMCTSLGASAHLTASDVDANLVARSHVLLLEAYLLDAPEGCAILEAAIEKASRHKTKIALALSDAACVDRHRDLIMRLIGHFSLIFANAREAMSLFQVPDVHAAADCLAATGSLGVLTRSEEGSLVVHAAARWAFPAVPTAVVDTTGAGDSYAAGFLSAFVKGAPIETCGERGSRIAALCIAQYGARPAAEALQSHTALPHHADRRQTA